jgi:hypothetical protein
MMMLMMTFGGGSRRWRHDIYYVSEHEW